MNALAFFLGIVGPWQIAVVVVLVVLLFGGKKIPELMKGLGSGIKEFKNAAKDEDATTPAKTQNQEENKL
ncbi:twin-arginine translocase TatA/TatE family subunit [uncultured Flavobacterium sp.]|uniref:twin-arginine translocase TatA/TatE family subunit n=1 Tax=uncultured Flavobacterium sp. TaxID=165435 RepID=UPI0025D6716A|nr:twin-arginine translocase TatA/TatE family subunit [uncultured Flavobacterium sp.]